MISLLAKAQHSGTQNLLNTCDAENHRPLHHLSLVTFIHFTNTHIRISIGNIGGNIEAVEDLFKKLVVQSMINKMIYLHLFISLHHKVHWNFSILCSLVNHNSNQELSKWLMCKE